MSSSDAIIDNTPDQYGQVHPHETPELIARKMALFEKEVKKLKSVDGKSVREAQLKCPELLTHKFKLMFLRAEVFNADLAAKRYGKYWTKRIDAFGKDKAFLPLTLEGAMSDPADQVAMATGFIEIVDGCTDNMGRAAMIIDSGRMANPNISTESIIRTLYYVSNAALEEHEEVQKYGGIIFGRPPSASGGISNFTSTTSRCKKVVKSCLGTIPFRLSVYHIVQPPYYLRPLITVAMMLLKESTKKRLRCHTSSNEELIKSLEADGLDRDTLPEYVGGNTKFDMEAWIEEKRVAGK